MCFRSSIVCALLMCWVQLSGLHSQQDSLRVDSLKIDVTVPDAPAFKILGIQPTKILRPGNVKDLAVTFSNFINSGGVLPTAFAVEISPLLFVNPTFAEYNASALSTLLYRTRLSIGTKAEGTARDVAIGLRFTIFDNTDPRSDTAYLNALYSALSGSVRNTNNIDDLAAKDVQNTLNIDTTIIRIQMIGSASSAPATGTIERKIYDLYQSRQQFYTSSSPQQVADFFKARQAKSAWNNTSMELGAAGKFSAPDSLLKSLSISRYELWLTLSLDGGETVQFLLGANASIGENTTTGRLTNGQAEAAARGNFGNDSRRGFLEVDWTAQEEASPTLNASLGYEFKVLDNIWLELAMGLKKQGSGDPVLTHKLDFRFSQ